MVNAAIGNNNPNANGFINPNLSPIRNIDRAPGIPRRDPTRRANPIWCSVIFDIMPNLSI